MSRSHRPICLAAIAAAVVALCCGAQNHADAAPPAAAATAAPAPTEQLRYKVHHSVFGDIGTYTNVVERMGTTTIVHTTAHFLVKMLGVGLHREDAQRTERWQDGRLVSFAGVTEKNGDTVQLKGKADGGDFLIASPLGTFTAPANVQPANPWSAKCLNATTMMRVDNGKVEQVRVTGGNAAPVAIEGATISTRQYEIDGSSKYRIWFDGHGVPVMFVVDDNTGKITFTLEQ